MKATAAKKRGKRNRAGRKNRITVTVFVSVVLVLLCCQLLATAGKRDKGLAVSSFQAAEDRSWQLVLVNAQNGVSGRENVPLVALSGGQSVDRRMYPALQRMFDACREDGLLPSVTSSYRTAERQERIFNAKVREFILSGKSKDDAVKEALGWAAQPGYSEHQTGLAVDVNSADEDRCPSNRIYAWLAENCASYGFILRYPENKKDITGVNYEPWHFRYVGEEAASEITANGQCLEEYLGAEERISSGEKNGYS